MLVFFLLVNHVISHKPILHLFIWYYKQFVVTNITLELWSGSSFKLMKNLQFDDKNNVWLTPKTKCYQS